MRPTETTVNEKFDAMIENGIRDMWNRLSKEASLKGTSLGTVADRAGISASAVYSSVRKIRNGNGEYTDTKVSQIMALADGLGMDLDEVLTGIPSPRETTVIEDLAVILPRLTEEARKQLRLELVAMLNV